MNEFISLMYHDVYSEAVSESGFQNSGAIKYKISIKSFEKQIKEISDYCENHSIKKNNIYLTFDDGGKSFLTIIAPILERNGFKGYFFITTKLINTFGFLTVDDIIELHQRGHIIGTHSHTHPRNISVLKDHEIANEWNESMYILKNILKKPVDCASIPGGFFSPTTANTLFSSGVNMIFTSTPGFLAKFGERKMICGRYSITQGMSSKEVVDIIKPFSVIRIKQSVKWKMLKILKLIFGQYYFIIRNNLIRTKY